MFGVLMISVILVIGGVLGNDVNWGKKVPCFIMDETVVCPGCNYRAGLSCPRDLKNSKNCLVSSTETSNRFPTSPPDTTYQETNSPETIDKDIISPETFKDIISPEKKYHAINATEGTLLPSSMAPPSKEIHSTVVTRNPIEVALLLHRILSDRALRHRYRYTREVEKMKQVEMEEIKQVEEEEDNDEGEVCNWNGDCPCPMICCKTGPGCPKRCVMGIRLPPPWGK